VTQVALYWAGQKEWVSNPLWDFQVMNGVPRFAVAGGAVALCSCTAVALHVWDDRTGWNGTVLRNRGAAAWIMVAYSALRVRSSGALGSSKRAKPLPLTIHHERGGIAFSSFLMLGLCCMHGQVFSMAGCYALAGIALAECVVACGSDS